MKVRVVAFGASNKREALRIAGDRALPHIDRRRWGYGVFVGETDSPSFKEAWFPTLAEAQAWAEEVTTVST